MLFLTLSLSSLLNDKHPPFAFPSNKRVSGTHSENSIRFPFSYSFSIDFDDPQKHKVVKIDISDTFSCIGMPVCVGATVRVSVPTNPINTYQYKCAPFLEMENCVYVNGSERVSELVSVLASAAW